MGNIIQYQVVVRTIDNHRIIYPAADEAWDEIDDARRVFDYHAEQCRQQKCKNVFLVKDDEGEEDKKTIDRFHATKA